MKTSKMYSTTWSSNASSAKYVTNEMLAPFIPKSICTTKVELTLSCKNLLNRDIATKSDPYCILAMKETWQDKYKDIFRTETIDNSLNPEWARKMIVNYNFETSQDLRFEVRDEDLNDKYDVLGVFETTLSDVVSYPGTQFVGKLTGVSKRNLGEIIIVSEEVSTCKQTVEVQFQAENLKRQSWLRNNEPFLVISRSNEDGLYSVVTRTEPISSTQNLTWKQLTLRLTTLCNGDYDRSIKIDCYDRRRNGSHKLIGTCFTTLRTIESQPLKLSKSEKQLKSNYEETGELKLVKFQITEEFTFLDYVRNGTQMHFAVAVDFTASNLCYTNPTSLHYLCANRLNHYEIALRSVGEIIQHYDSSQLFPAFGFGAKIPPSGQISHQFPLNGNDSYPFCSGIKEILVHYRKCLKTVELYGPTRFAPVINNTIKIASQFKDGKHYFVLLIMTDGLISDMHQTKQAIINASTLPISIIIVGVGNNKFNRMDELDSDDVRLNVEGRYAERDIVQFVPFNKFLANNKTAHIKSKADLAKHVLAEIPYQLISFMESVGYKPEMKQTDNPPDPSVLIPTAPMLFD